MLSSRIFHFVILSGFLLSPAVFAAQSQVYVPADYSTIQAAIDAVTDGDTIYVLPGTYYENIDFGGKNIVLTSTDPADSGVVESTVIDGRQNGPVVRFSGTETPESKLIGFTIAHGHWEGISGNGTIASIMDCMITESSGVGLFECHGRIDRCVIKNNAQGLNTCHGFISNCTIVGNAGLCDGAGLYNCDGTIVNCLIIGNIAETLGLGLGLGGGLARCDGPIINCTIVRNTGEYLNGGMYACAGPIVNCIIWGNMGWGDQVSPSITPSYSCIQDWPGGGIGNISSDPLFTDAEDWDYHLESEYGRWDPNTLQWFNDDVSSPCIDAGDPALMVTYLDPNDTPADPNDDFPVYLATWQNELWPHGGRINMGAYGGTPAASMSPNPVGNMADFNHDNAVDVSDFTLFCEDWLRAEYLLDADLNRNGVVDIADFANFTAEWMWLEP